MAFIPGHLYNLISGDKATKIGIGILVLAVALIYSYVMHLNDLKIRNDLSARNGAAEVVELSQKSAIYHILLQIRPSPVSISERGMHEMCIILSGLCDRIGILAKIEKNIIEEKFPKKSLALTKKEIDRAIKFILPDNLLSHQQAVIESCLVKLRNFETSHINPNSPLVSYALGLQLPLGAIVRVLIARKHAHSVNADAAVSLTGTLEWLCAEILNKAGDIAAVSKEYKITEIHIREAAICNDDFKSVFGKIAYEQQAPFKLSTANKEFNCDCEWCNIKVLGGSRTTASEDDWYSPVNIQSGNIEKNSVLEDDYNRGRSPNRRRGTNSKRSQVVRRSRSKSAGAIGTSVKNKKSVSRTKVGTNNN